MTPLDSQALGFGIYVGKGLPRNAFRLFQPFAGFHRFAPLRFDAFLMLLRVGVLSPHQVVKGTNTTEQSILGYSTSEITEPYYVQKDTTRLTGITAVTHNGANPILTKIIP